MTLTYGGGLVPASEVLTYSDVQKYLKRLRKSGHKFRYFAVGEYGSAKGRAHWHLILFYQKQPPGGYLHGRSDEKHWPHGFSQSEVASNASIRYCVKYLYKDLGADEAKQAKFVLSKNPAIGVPYFRNLGRDYAQQGVVPRDCFYWFPDVLNSKTGLPEKFYLSKQSKVMREFLTSFCIAWYKVHGNDRWPHSDLLDWWVDGNTRMATPRLPPPKSPSGGSQPLYDHSRGLYYSTTISGRLWFVQNSEGINVWATSNGKNENAGNGGTMPLDGTPFGGI